MPRVVDDREPVEAPQDVRQEAAGEPDRDDGHDPDTVRVPSANETTESVRRAQRALVELKQRHEIDQHRAAEEARERDAELARLHAGHTNTTTNDRTDGRSDDRTYTDERAAEDVNDAAGDEFSPVLEVGVPDDH
jgi:hypothetical protein